MLAVPDFLRQLGLKVDESRCLSRVALYLSRIRSSEVEDRSKIT